jgi:dolichol-phosphate mannosyltransferase
VSPSVIVIVPTYNERANLPVLAERLMSLAGVRLLVVDDQSPDGTGEVAEALGRQHAGRIEVVRRTGRRGLGRSYIDGMRHALGAGYDVICQMDADLSHDPRQLPALVAAVETADLAIGSRYVPGGAIVNWPRRREWLSRFANGYVRAVTRLEIRDATSGFRCWRADTLRRLPLERFMSDGYSFQVETLFTTVRLGLRVVEVPITFTERREGRSKLSRGIVLESVVMPWRLIASPERARKAPAEPRR